MIAPTARLMSVTQGGIEQLVTTNRNGKSCLKKKMNEEHVEKRVAFHDRLAMKNYKSAEKSLNNLNSLFRAFLKHKGVEPEPGEHIEAGVVLRLPSRVNIDHNSTDSRNANPNIQSDSEAINGEYVGNHVE